MNNYLKLAVIAALLMPLMSQSNDAERLACRPVPLNRTDVNVAYACFGASVGRLGVSILYNYHIVDGTMLKAADLTASVFLLAGALYLAYRIYPVAKGDNEYKLYYTKTPKFS